MDGDYFTKKPENTKLPTKESIVCPSPCENPSCIHLLAQQCKVIEIQSLKTHVEEQDNSYKEFLIQDQKGLSPIFYLLSRKTDTSNKYDIKCKNPIVQTLKVLNAPGIIDLRLQNKNQTIFHYAAARGHWQALGYLIIQENSQNYANVVDSEGRTPIFYAVESIFDDKRFSRLTSNDLLNTIRVLLALGTDVSIQGRGDR